MSADRIDRGKLAALQAREEERLAERTPRSRALLERARRSMPAGVPMAWMAGLYHHPPLFVTKGAGAYFEDVDGHRYLDMNQADLSAAAGFAPAPVVAAVAARTRDGGAFLLPTEDGIAAAEELAGRTGLPFWQFTGSASAANMEAIRLARLATGRSRLLMFEGKYHGHLDDTMVERSGNGAAPEVLGLRADVEKQATVVGFNDLDAVARALRGGDVACLIAEPMLTNCNIVFPDTGFWAAVRTLCRETGTLLAIDEAHCFTFAFGGLTRAWRLQPDILTLGKGFGSGIAFGAYGVSEPLARLMERKLDYYSGQRGLGIGGTTFANAITLAAARATLEHVLTAPAYDRLAELGTRLGDGLEAIFRRRGLAWRAPRIGGRSGWVLAPALPRDAAASAGILDLAFTDARRLYMLNRGVWEAIASAGPAASFAHDAADVDRYLAVADAFLGEIVAG